MIRRSTPALAAPLAAVLAVLCFASDALAQQPVPDRTTTTTTAPPRRAPAKRELSTTMERLTERGQVTLGVSTAFSFTRVANEKVTNDGDNVNSTFFLLLSPELGYFISDRFQITFDAGVLFRRLDRGDGETATERDWLLELGVKYFVPITSKVSFIPGAGLGFYLGSSTRPVAATNEAGDLITTNEETSAFGIDLMGMLSLGYQVGERTIITGGLNLHFLAGSENIPSLDKRLGVTTLNAGLDFGINYFF